MGVFGAPQGVRGEIRVKSLTAESGRHRRLRAAHRQGAGKEHSRSNPCARSRTTWLVARVAGVSTREAAEALKGVEIFARRDQLPPPAQDEFYVDDLVGLEAVDADGARLGRVVSLMNYGAGDILEIAPAEGGETLLLPFTKSVILEVDFDAGAITVARPREI